MTVSDLKQSGYLKGLFVTLTMTAAMSANAALIDQGDGSIYDTDRNIYWAKNGNLFRTQVVNSGNATAFVNQIISAAGGVINDAAGTHTLTAADFQANIGRMSWWGAKAWIAYLNSINYGGHRNWRLPDARNANGSGPCTNNCADSELGDLLHNELGGPFGVSITPPNNHNSSYNLFTGIQSSFYWNGTEVDGAPEFAWTHSSAEVGLQVETSKDSAFGAYAFALRDGEPTQVPALPPLAMWLLGAAIVGIQAGFKRKR